MEYSAKGATLSSDRLCRYTLSREWKGGNGLAALFVMLNPSKANAYKDDPTIRRCSSFARSWGFSKLTVVNLFAYRATDPEKLLEIPSKARVGKDNDTSIILSAEESDFIICAWGAWGEKFSRRVRAVTHFLRHRRLWCFDVTRSGHPAHPLYQRSRPLTDLVRFSCIS